MKDSHELDKGVELARSPPNPRPLGREVERVAFRPLFSNHLYKVNGSTFLFYPPNLYRNRALSSEAGRPPVIASPGLRLRGLSPTGICAPKFFLSARVISRCLGRLE